MTASSSEDSCSLVVTDTVGDSGLKSRICSASQASMSEIELALNGASWLFDKEKLESVSWMLIESGGGGGAEIMYNAVESTWLATEIMLWVIRLQNYFLPHVWRSQTIPKAESREASSQ